VDRDAWCRRRRYAQISHLNAVHFAGAVQVVEHALSAVCNFAAGSQAIKQQLCDAGLVHPVIELLASCGDRTLQQLAALALRNLLRNPKCRAEIVRLNGVGVLLDFLSEGVENLQYPLHAEARALALAELARRTLQLSTTGRVHRSLCWSFVHAAVALHDGELGIQ
jgi:Armadillo/beta-catenin-like repeat